MRRDRLGGERSAVVAIAHRQHLIALAVARRQQERRVVGLGTRRREKDPSIGNAREATDPLGEFDHGFIEVQRRGVHHLRGLLGGGGSDLRVVVPDHGGEHPAEEVEVAVATNAEDMASLAAIDGDRLGKHRLHERRQYGAVAGVEIGVDRRRGGDGFHAPILPARLIAYKQTLFYTKVVAEQPALTIDDLAP